MAESKTSRPRGAKKRRTQPVAPAQQDPELETILEDQMQATGGPSVMPRISLTEEPPRPEPMTTDLAVRPTDHGAGLQSQRQGVNSMNGHAGLFARASRWVETHPTAVLGIAGGAAGAALLGVVAVATARHLRS